MHHRKATGARALRQALQLSDTTRYIDYYFLKGSLFYKVDIRKDKNYLRLCRLYPDIFKIDNYQHFVEKNVDNTTYSCNREDYITHRDKMDTHKLRHTGNIRIKTYLDGSCDILVCDSQLFRQGELFEQEKRGTFLDVRGERFSDTLQEVQLLQWDSQRPPDLIGFDDFLPYPQAPSPVSIRRAQARLKELLLSNDFDYFVTLTLSADKVDRYNYAEIIKPLSKWLDNRVQRKGWKYILVPELHEDGAIHFHGVVSGDMKLEDSGTVKVHSKKKPVRWSTYNRYYKGASYSVVYNCPDWKYGFTTAVGLDDKPHAVARYISKYITKDSRKVGGRWYLSGGDLKRPEIDVIRGSFYDFAALFKIFQIEGRKEKFVAFRVSADGQLFGTPNEQ